MGSCWGRAFASLQRYDATRKSSFGRERALQGRAWRLAGPSFRSVRVAQKAKLGDWKFAVGRVWRDQRAVESERGRIVSSTMVMKIISTAEISPNQKGRTA